MEGIEKENKEKNKFLQELQELMGYKFSEPALLEQALTHRSFAHEHSDQQQSHNESMEFLGDSILGFVVSEELYRRYPAAAEGSLSKAKAYLVSAASIYRLAKDLDLGSCLRLSFGEEKTGGRKKRALLVDAFEALIAALYLDGGLGAAQRFIGKQLQKALDDMDVDRVRYEDFKSTLQERLHLMHMPEPVYNVVKEVGPDHAKTFSVEVRVGDSIAARADGRTKKEAQQNAAKAALLALES
jgi:ribonuclease-3